MQVVVEQLADSLQPFRFALVCVCVRDFGDADAKSQMVVHRRRRDHISCFSTLHSARYVVTRDFFSVLNCPCVTNHE